MLPSGTADAALSWLFPEPDPYADDPVRWIQERLGAFLWSKQIEVCQSVLANRYTAVKACHGPGKSFIASRLGCWWLSAHDLGSAFLVTTAPSWPQVQAILWREIRRAHRQGKLPGRITMDCHWYLGEGGIKKDEELIAMGRKPQDYDEQAFQGIHARYLLVVLDEACGIPVALWNAVKTLMTNPFARVLAIGNPDDPASEFANVCKPGSGWNVITINAFDTPNFTGEPIPEQLKYDLVSPEWVDERRRDWGEGTSLWVSKVLGEFPDVSDDFLITPKMMQIAYDTHFPGLDGGRYGVDVARYGDDKTCVYRNRGGQLRHVDSWAKLDTMQSAGRLSLIMDNHPVTRVPMMIDTIGLGAGVYDRLRERGYEVGGFEGSMRAFRPHKFKNRRAEIYWTFRQMMDDGLIDLDPADEGLAAELTSIKWFVDSGGRIQIESKEDMKARGLPSPNRADAAVLSTVTMAEIGKLIVEDESVDFGDPLTRDLLTKVM